MLAFLPAPAVHPPHTGAQVVDILSESLSLAETAVPLKIARLFLLSDLLHNATAPVRNASRYRAKLQVGWRSRDGLAGGHVACWGGAATYGGKAVWGRLRRLYRCQFVLHSGVPRTTGVMETARCSNQYTSPARLNADATRPRFAVPVAPAPPPTRLGGTLPITHYTLTTTPWITS